MKMKHCWALIAVMTLALVCALAGEEKAILEVAPSLSELGHGWTTNLVTYLIDPRSRPAEIDYRGDPLASPELAEQRKVMKTNGRTGCAMVLYGHGDLLMNSGLYRVCIQRWADKRSLHNAWAKWKMDTGRVLRSNPAVGEDLFWTNESWRDTLLYQNLIFRRGLFHVVIQAGAESDYRPMIRLAEIIDAKIRGKAIPKENPPDGQAAGN